MEEATGAHCLYYFFLGFFFFALEANCSLEIKRPTSGGGGGWEEEVGEVEGGCLIRSGRTAKVEVGRPAGGVGREGEGEGREGEGLQPGGEVLFSSCQF